MIGGMGVRWISAQQVRSLLGQSPWGSPVYQELAERLRLLVVDGRLSIGVRMPSERDLAEVLHLSRSTVAAAYGQLRESGFLASRTGSGSFVVLPHVQASGAQLPGLFAADPADVISLTYASGPAPAGMASAFAAAAERLPGLLAGHGYFPDGIVELRSVLADWFTGRGLPTTPDQMVITSGALAALNLVTRTVLSAGDRVLVESPTYANAIEVVRQVSRPVPYPLSDAGWDTDDFDLAVRQSVPRLCYLIPDFHNPTGAWMSEEDRPQIAKSLRRQGTIPVIDETLVELTLDHQPLRAPMARYLPEAVTIGSASKAFWGGLRIGWIRAPHDLVRPLVETRATLDLGAAPFEQLVLADLVSGPGEVLAAQRDRVREQRDHLGRELATALPDWSVSAPAGGLALWATLPDECSSRMAAQAERHGLALTAGPRFFVAGGGERQLRIPYTARPEVLSAAVRRLSSLWSEVQSQRGSRQQSLTLGLTA